MSFEDSLNAFNVKVQTRTPEIFVQVATHAHRSVQTGSATTGAPGQPVDTGNLKAAWQLNFVAPLIAEVVIGANQEEHKYARSIEDGISYAHGGTPLTLRSAVGGFHSVAQTIAGLPAIVEEETKRVTG